jgi:NAD+ synthase
MLSTTLTAPTDMAVDPMLQLDPAAAVEKAAEALRAALQGPLKRRGFVIAMSGGIDSSVCAGLVVRAVGPRRVFGIFMPERDSDPQSLALAKEWADKLGIEYALEDITDALEGAGCYRRRDEAVKRVVPEFGEGWRFKLVLPGDRLNSDQLNVSSITVQSPDGELKTHRLPAAEYRQIVAATNFKQRVRKMMEYYHADRLHYAVVGTPNRLEYDQGFFVKGGDGLADVKPIAHLYKTQAYQIAEYLGVPQGIISRPPTTDTFSLPQGQDEFYFSLPAAMMDRLLFLYNGGASPEAAAERLGLVAEQVGRAFRDFEQKRSTTRYLHLSPVLVEPVPEITTSAAS